MQSDRETFIQSYCAGTPQLLKLALVADCHTPVSCYHKICGKTPFAFLFESVEGGAFKGRYSCFGCAPDRLWRYHEQKTAQAMLPSLNLSALHQATITPEQIVWQEDSRPTLVSLRDFLDHSRFDLPSQAPPMAAGVFGYMGYAMAGLAERIPDTKPDILHLPDCYLFRPQLIGVFDNLTDILTLYYVCHPRPELSAAQAYEFGLSLLHNALERLNKPLSPEINQQVFMQQNASCEALLTETNSNTSRAEFYHMVEKARDYIHAGDIFQTVLSQRFAFLFTKNPFDFYRALRRINPSPFLFYINFPDFQLVGSSPEIMVRLRDQKLTLRPLAGTRKRGETPQEDAALAKDLLSDPKECAEHLMLLDLGRNDVGRVAEIGSVEVPSQFTIEYYSHVMHISSEVTGTLRPDQDAVDALLAALPAGTVSGAPKIRAMEIINELEQEKRGVYAGAIGYFGAGGDLDSCIALRTAVISKGNIYIQAGAGIVADSNPQSEYEETCNKAGALVKALLES